MWKHTHPTFYTPADPGLRMTGSVTAPAISDSAGISPP